MEKDNKIIEIEDMLSKLIQDKTEEEYLEIVNGNEYLSKYDSLMADCETEKIDINLLDNVLKYLKAIKK